MASIGLPVPPGFTLTTEVCTHFYQNDCNYPKELTQQAFCLEICSRIRRSQGKSSNEGGQKAIQTLDLAWGFGDLWFIDVY